MTERSTTYLRPSRQMLFAVAAPLAVAVITVALPSPARADEPVNAPYEPSYKNSLTLVPYDSGYVPANSPVQLRLTAEFRDDFDIDMEGTCTYDWSEQALSIEGAPSGGQLVYSLGGEIGVEAVVSLGGFMASAPLGPYALDIPAAVSFDPYLLPGNPDHPVSIATAFSIPLVDETFPLGTATGQFALEVDFQIVGVTFQADDVDWSDSENGRALATLDVEGGTVTVPLVEPTSPDTASAWARMHGLLSSDVVLTLKPSLTVSGLPGGITIPIALDLPVDIPVVSDADVEIGPTEVTLPAPALPPEPGTTDDGDLTTDDGVDPTTDDAGDPTTDDTTTGGAGESSESGCGCSSSAPPPAAITFALLVIGLLGLNTRRDRRSAT